MMHTNLPKIKKTKKGIIVDVYEIDPLWNLSDAFSVTNAAILIAEVDPKKFEHMDNLDPLRDEIRRKVDIIEEGLFHAIEIKTIEAKVSYYDHNWSYGGECDGSATINPRATTITREELEKWLAKKKISSKFFLTPTPNHSAADYLDEKHERYSAKLAAAVRAWQAVSETDGMHPKQKLSRWLEKNAATLGLTNKDSTLNKAAIEEIAKVANWKTTGGAPRTPEK